MPKKSLKGFAWERALAKRLSLWWTAGASDAVFWRTPTSGGRATSRRKKGLQTRNQSGDLLATDPIGQPLLDLVAIEAKKGYARNTIHDLLDRPARAKEQMFEEWFRKAQTMMENANAYAWLLITWRDRREPLVFLPGYLCVGLGLMEALAKFTVANWSSAVFCYRLDHFLSSVSPDTVRSLVAKLKESA